MRSKYSSSSPSTSSLLENATSSLSRERASSHRCSPSAEDIPRVIPKVYNKLSQELKDSPRKDKSMKNGELVLGHAFSPLGNYSKGTSLDNGTDANTAVRDQDDRTIFASIEHDLLLLLFKMRALFQESSFNPLHK